MSDQQKAAKWAYDLLNEQNFVILDTETTGLNSIDEICQIAVINWQGETLHDSYIKPTCAISPNATAIHGISQEMVWGAPRFLDQLPHLMRAIGTRDLVIYNAEFDLKMIRQSLKPEQIPLAFPTSDRRQCRIWLGGGSIHCAMLQYSKWIGEWNEFHGDYRWQKLPGGDHSALGDCRATLDIICRMADSYKPQDPVDNEPDDITSYVGPGGGR